MAEPLHQQLLAFNFYPSQHLQPSWWPWLQAQSTTPGILPDNLTAEQLNRLNARQPQLISRWLLNQFTLDGQYDFDFHSPEKQLLLQGPEVLQTLCHYLTALAYHPFIASLLAAKKVNAIKQALGEDAYHFAVKQAPLLLNQIPEFLQKDMVETSSLDFTDPVKLGEQLSPAGITLLISAGGQYTQALQWRLRWKLPFTDKLTEVTSPATESDNQVAQHKLCQQLIKKVCKQLPQTDAK